MGWIDNQLLILIFCYCHKQNKKYNVIKVEIDQFFLSRLTVQYGCSICYCSVLDVVYINITVELMYVYTSPLMVIKTFE